MITTNTLVASVLALTLGAAAARAQTEVTEDGGATPQADQQQAPARQQEPATTAGAPGPAAADQRAPGDYRASEEISEDLSVSFPVDI